VQFFGGIVFRKIIEVMADDFVFRPDEVGPSPDLGVVYFSDEDLWEKILVVWGEKIRFSLMGYTWGTGVSTDSGGEM
jgi:hypothetical protein